MTTTARHALPLIAPEQAQKHVTHNEALALLDGVTQLSFAAMGLAIPPADPAPGATYEVGAGASGAWTGRDGAIAVWTEGGWRFSMPGEGWLGWDSGAGRLVVFRSGGWTPVLEGIDALGVNTGTDATNRLAVRSEAALFTAIPAGEGGNGNVRLTLNKEAPGDSATLIFQSGWSGRAEIGLSGDDDFAFKVSADGSGFATAMIFSPPEGFVTFAAIAGSAVSFPVVAAGVLAVGTSYVVPQPETGTADTIETIAGGFDGAVLIVTGTSGTALTFRDAIGNLRLGADRVLDDVADSLILVRRGTDWIALSYRDNG